MSCFMTEHDVIWWRSMMSYAILRPLWCHILSHDWSWCHIMTEHDVIGYFKAIMMSYLVWWLSMRSYHDVIWWLSMYVISWCHMMTEHVCHIMMSCHVIMSQSCFRAIFDHVSDHILIMFQTCFMSHVSRDMFQTQHRRSVSKHILSLIMNFHDVCFISPI
jgi:hypothetical protein